MLRRISYIPYFEYRKKGCSWASTHPVNPPPRITKQTRSLRAGTPARDGAAPSRTNFFVRLRAAWKSMRNPEASPEELGYVPHLRSRLIAILVTALGIACLIIGLSTYVTLQNSLYQQAQSDQPPRSAADLPRRQARRSGLQ